MRNKKGITLTSLVVAVIILIILAGVGIGTLGPDGLIAKAEEAKEQAQIDEEREIVGTSAVEAAGANRYGNIEKEELEIYVNKNAGERNIEVLDNVEKLIVNFKDSNRYYIIEDDGNVSNPIAKEEILEVKLNCINSNNDVLKSVTTLAIYGNIEVPQTIITDEGIEYTTENSVIEATSNEINIKYMLVCKDDKTLVFTQSGNEYMLGTNEGQSEERKWY